MYSRQSFSHVYRTWTELSIDFYLKKPVKTEKENEKSYKLMLDLSGLCFEYWGLSKSQHHFRKCFINLRVLGLLACEMPSAETHVSDLGVGTLLRLPRGTEQLIHTRAGLRAPHTLVFGVGVLTQAAVFTSQRAVIQSDWNTNPE